MATQSKTEEATPKKKKDQRKKGNVFLSKDAVSVATMFGSFCALRLAGGQIVDQIQRYIQFCFSSTVTAPSGGIGSAAREIFAQGMVALAIAAGPMLAVTALMGVAATFAQTRMLVSAESLKPKFSRINPLEGFKRLFSVRGVVDTLKGAIKIVVLLYIIYHYLKGAVNVFVQYLYTDLATACMSLFSKTFTMMMQIAAAYTVIAGLDFLYQWWEYGQEMKMTKQEVKEEYKQTEGDPQIKSKIKSIQRQMSQTRMMQQVPTADVIIRNPTHFAVALRYDQEKDNAPVVVAKGQDEIALRIIKVGEENQVSVVENIPLARALYARSELNREIPPEFYGEVADILVYLYRVNAGVKTK